MHKAERRMALFVCLHVDDLVNVETRKLAFKNVRIREIEKMRSEKLDRRQLHGTQKIAAECWLN